MVAESVHHETDDKLLPAAMTLGCNYPWAFNKYGLYFGPHPAEPWMDRWLEFFAENLLEIAALGLKVVRIFLLCAGENYGKLVFRAGGRVAFDPPRPIDAKFLEHLERMLETVKASGTGIKLVPSILDFGFFGPVVGNSGGRWELAGGARLRDAFLATVLDPFLTAARPYVEHIHAWEVINEPYWNCHFFAPPLYRGPFRMFPHLPRVTVDAMRSFLNAALERIEAAGFESTVGHRFYADLAYWPGGTRPQFHYYGKRVLSFGDPKTIPAYAETGGAFIGEIDPGDAYGRLWPELHGADRDPRRRAFERLKLLARKGYRLSLVWPELGWSAPEDKDPVAWQAHLADPLKLTPETKDGIKQFTHGRWRGGVP
jgi:hypothetical protein